MESSKTVNPDGPLIQENRLVRDIYFTGPLFLESLSINMRGKPLYLPFTTSRKTHSLLFRNSTTTGLSFLENHPDSLFLFALRCIPTVSSSPCFYPFSSFSPNARDKEWSSTRLRAVSSLATSHGSGNLLTGISRRRSLRPYENSGRNGHWVGQRSCGADQTREWGGES